MQPIGSGLLKAILSKAIGKYQAKISFVFCRQFVEYTKKRAQLMKLIANKHVNIYRVEKVELDSFKLVPFSKDAKIYSNPTATCIIFEFCGVNFYKTQTPSKRKSTKKRTIRSNPKHQRATEYESKAAVSEKPKLISTRKKAASTQKPLTARQQYMSAKQLMQQSKSS